MPQSPTRPRLKQIPQWDDEEDQEKAFVFSDSWINILGSPSGSAIQEGEQVDITSPEILPILPLRGLVVFPQTAVPLTIGQPRSIKLVDDVVAGEQRLIGLVTSKNPDIETPGAEDLFGIGTLGIIHRLFRAPDGTIRLLIQGLSRFNIIEYTQQEPYFKARVSPRPEIIETGIEVEALSRNARDQFEHIAGLIPSIPRELIGTISSIQDPLQTVYTIANFQRMELNDAQTILEQDSLMDKLRKLVAILTRESEVLDLGQKIQNEARSEIEKVQREYFLREQIRAIKKELGEIDEQAADIEDLREKLQKASPTEEALTMANREMDRLTRLPTAAAEYGVIRTYIEWIASLPWKNREEDNLDIEHAQKILNEDHYGLDEIKRRIIEFLAVRKLRMDRKSALSALPDQDLIRHEREGGILCFIGPPGVGKTSLGKSIARAMGRKFLRISLGGMRDEAEIRGHRRTYIGAMPGRIIQAIRRIGSQNPVFMLDEIDKITMDFHGDPAAALLEVLDPEQNIEFRDNYLEVAFDLSQVMFITTANQAETIPAPLLDRMELIRLAGYTEQEKVQIATHYLIPRQIRENGLLDNEIQFEDTALVSIINNYTREAGVRNLERQIGAVCRKIAVKVSSKKSHRQFIIKSSHLKSMIGRPLYLSNNEINRRTSIPGVATGLAWTPFGGDILFIEATSMPGGKSFNITGSVGNVMQESAQAALSYIRTNAVSLNIDPNFYNKLDIHLHIPSGAQPKDGPSAGVTIATAIASLLSNISIDPTVGMTGEITLRGQVLPVGGIKEKVLAAHRAGLKTIILPRENKLDLEGIPKEIRASLRFVFADTVDDVFRLALRKDRKRNTLSSNHPDQ